MKIAHLIIEEDSSKGNVVKIIDAVKESGADPVVLQIDCLPE